MPNVFDSVSVNKIRHTLFNLSHMRKFSCDMGFLYPVQVLEVNPNETFHFNHECLVKFAPMVAPVMQEIDMFIESFFVPNRLLWKKWDEFITPSDDGTFPSHPYLTIRNSTTVSFPVGGLGDFLGIPPAVDFPGESIRVDVFPFCAYQLIYNWYYRDQNLQDEISIPFDMDGYVGSSSFTGYSDLISLRRRCWPKDYFTSALPNTQRGGDVSLPFGGDAPIKYVADGYSDRFVNGQGSGVNGINSAQQSSAFSSGSLGYLSANMQTSSAGNQLGIDNSRHLFADMSSVTSATVAELRRAVALQEYLELNMRVGGRIDEYIYGNFGQHVPDYRLDKPQFLGGYRAPITVSQVNQTSSTDATSPLAEMAGQAIGAGSTRKFKYHSYEHGWIISLFSVLPKASYQQGLPRKFTRFEPLDYANPKFANIGEQAILNKEIYVKSSDPDGVFGYAPRYAEYKYEPSTIHGEFRDSLSFWHMGNIYDSAPVLNGSFVEAQPTSRIYAVEGTLDHLRVEMYNRVKALRPLPYYGTPKLL